MVPRGQLERWKFSSLESKNVSVAFCRIQSTYIFILSTLLTPCFCFRLNAVCYQYCVPSVRFNAANRKIFRKVITIEMFCRTVLIIVTRCGAQFAYLFVLLAGSLLKTSLHDSCNSFFNRSITSIPKSFKNISFQQLLKKTHL